MGRAFLVPQVLRALGDHEGVRLYWSYWEGYLERPEQGRLVDLAKNIGDPIMVIHSSGHASTDDLARLVKAIRPGSLVPIHTEHPAAYAQLGLEPTLVPDGQPKEIQ